MQTRLRMSKKSSNFAPNLGQRAVVSSPTVNICRFIYI